MSSPSVSDQPVITNAPSLNIFGIANISPSLSAPSLSSPSTIDPSQLQIRILQQQLYQLNKQSAISMQQMQEAANAAQINMQTQIQNAQTTYR
jgi:hypothetical protein